MNPVDLKAEGHEGVIEFAKHQEQFNTLPAVRRDDGAIWSLWQPTEAEAKALANGARVGLWVWTYGLPLQPVALEVEGVAEDEKKCPRCAGPVPPSSALALGGRCPDCGLRAPGAEEEGATLGGPGPAPGRGAEATV